MQNRIFNSALLVLALISGTAIGSDPILVHRTERPTLNPYTGDPRPDILPYYIHHRIPEYRRVYNRPRYVTGLFARFIEPTSQEAMVWEENCVAGAYSGKHCPPRYKRYFAPKPWEVLQTGSRRDFPEDAALVPEILGDEEEQQLEEEVYSPKVVPPLVPEVLDEQPPVSPSETESSRTPL